MYYFLVSKKINWGNISLPILPSKKKTYEKNNPGNNEIIYLQSVMWKHVEVVGGSNHSLSIEKDVIALKWRLGMKIKFK